ncbi:MAG: hypothetical protein QG583_606 [Patescibacteria group bacterium]|nr:hypothetical protein [Patescibacteria group bacterium]
MKNKSIFKKENNNKDYDKFVKLILSNKKDLKEKLPELIKGKKEIQKGVYVGSGVLLEPNIFFDTGEGEIVLGENTKVKANTILRGPLIIGKNCVINSFAEISHSQIGDVCKIGGEVEESIIQSYSNKQHYGFLGHSYIGSWVNIGGGTNVSNLKNTYSNIKVNGVDTSSVFMGCIMGDYCKTAINTSIFCGKVIGESSHLYGIVSQDVPAFVSYVGPGKMYELPLEIAERIQKTMMKRRGLEFTAKDSENFKKLFKETISDRKKAKAKKGKLSFN